MNFQIEELTQQVANTTRDFAQQHIRPHVMEWDETQEFPVSLFREMGKLGLMGVLVPEQYGGSGFSYFEYKTVIEEIAKVCGSIGITDANRIDESEKEKIRGSEIIVLNALRKAQHISHFNLSEAIQQVKELEIPASYFTHISHQLGRHADVEAELPKGCHLAFDRLTLNL